MAEAVLDTFPGLIGVVVASEAMGDDVVGMPARLELEAFVLSSLRGFDPCLISDVGIMGFEVEDGVLSTFAPVDPSELGIVLEIAVLLVPLIASL